MLENEHQAKGTRPLKTKTTMPTAQWTYINNRNNNKIYLESLQTEGIVSSNIADTYSSTETYEAYLC